MAKRDCRGDNNENNHGFIQSENLIMPFHTDQWLTLKELILKDSDSIDDCKEILSILCSLEQRDSEKGRYGLALTYEIYNVRYHCLTFDRTTNLGKGTLQPVVSSALHRSVDHLHQILGHLNRKESPTYRYTMEQFGLSPTIADLRNDIAHGEYPSLSFMLNAMEEIKRVVIKRYWKAFNGEIFSKQCDRRTNDIICDLAKKIKLYLENFIFCGDINKDKGDEIIVLFNKCLENDMNFFMKTLLSDKMLLEDEKGKCLKASRGDFTIKETDRKYIEKIYSFLGEALGTQSRRFEFLVEVFQRIMTESDRKKRMKFIMHYELIANAFIRKQYFFLPYLSKEIVKWEMNLSIVNEKAEILTFSEYEFEVSQFRSELYQKAKIPKNNNESLDEISDLIVNQHLPWGKLVRDRYHK
uniref:HEPN_Cthe2314 domain-containing protein n=1 Tax=Parastrongyloides trichosuri TaxID=131310 RepID=A0A0N4ZLK9_PARTI